MSNYKRKIFFITIFALYFGFIVWFCLLSRETGERAFVPVGVTFTAVLQYPWTWILMVMIIANVLLYVPVGALLERIIHSKKITVFLGISISIGIEIMQYVLARGTLDIDDIINNSVGTLIGAYLFEGIGCFRERKRFHQFPFDLKMVLALCSLYSLMLIRHIWLHFFWNG